jgi:hypothetical protein
MLTRSLATVLVTLAVLTAPGLSAAPAAAAPPACGVWTAGMEEDEGGPVLTASVCSDGSTGSPQLLLQCFGGALLSYDLGSTAGNIEPGAKAKFTFDIDGKSIAREMTLEAMYNYYTLDLKPDDPLLAALSDGLQLRVESADYGANAFSLRGAKAAIGKVLAGCK